MKTTTMPVPEQQQQQQQQSFDETTTTAAATAEAEAQETTTTTMLLPPPPLELEMDLLAQESTTTTTWTTQELNFEQFDDDQQQQQQQRPLQLFDYPPFTNLTKRSTTTTTRIGGVVNLRPFDMTPFCEPGVFFDDSRKTGCRFDDDAFYNLPAGPILEVEEATKNVLKFQHENLNTAVWYVQLYRKTRKVMMDWYHVMILKVAYPSFREAMFYQTDEEGRPVENETKVLPFSCCCDGGNFNDPKYRHHRHVIVVSPKGDFEKNIYNRIKVPRDQRLVKHYRCKGKKLIKTTMHLVNILVYVSKRRARCTFDKKRNKKWLDDYEYEEDEDEDEEDDADVNDEHEEEEEDCHTPLSHFKIFRELPRDSKFVLALQWDGGISRLLCQKYRFVKYSDLASLPLEHQGRYWCVRIKDLPDPPIYIELPVCHLFKPSVGNHETPYFVHTLNGRKLYFSPAADDDVSMKNNSNNITTTTKHTNCSCCLHVHDLVEEEWWKPHGKQQRFLDNHMPTVYRNQYLEQEMEKIKRKHEDEKTEWHAKLARLEKDNETLRQENERLRTRQENSPTYNNNVTINNYGLQPQQQ